MHLFIRVLLHPEDGFIGYAPQNKFFFFFFSLNVTLQFSRNKYVYYAGFRSTGLLVFSENA